MIDINFYRRVESIIKNFKFGYFLNEDKETLFNYFEKYRSRKPIIFSIETIDKNVDYVETIDDEKFFLDIVNQIKPHSYEEWEKWKHFLKREYKMSENDMNEKHLYYYIMANTIQLDGCCDIFCEKKIKILKEKDFKVMIKCNFDIGDIDIEKYFIAGVDYIKCDVKNEKDCEKVCKLLEIKNKGKYGTIIIVITALEKNKKRFDKEDVYSCYNEKGDREKKEICKYLWMSMVVKSDGSVVSCIKNNNNLGNIKNDSLINIWNGKKYFVFRKNHFYIKNNNCICNMKLIGECFK